MKNYTFTFIGRETGAIGIRYQITATVQAKNQRDAELKLYDRYEHIGEIVLVSESEVRS